jgi:hypothetical protein
MEFTMVGRQLVYLVTGKEAHKIIIVRRDDDREAFLVDILVAPKAEDDGTLRVSTPNMALLLPEMTVRELAHVLRQYGEVPAGQFDELGVGRDHSNVPSWHANMWRSFTRHLWRRKKSYRR